MELKRLLNLIERNISNRLTYEEAKRYYNNQNDIESTGVVSTSSSSNKDGKLRNADNRISHWYHGLLIDEKASYMFTYPPILDIDDNKNNVNEKVLEVVGDDFSYTLQDLCIESSNCGVAWLHYWIDSKGEFKYHRVNTEECIPIYDKTLLRNLQSFIRYYDLTESEEKYRIIEYWDDKSLIKYKVKEGILKESIEIQHKFERVPFIKFANNSLEKSDLSRYKNQIDLFDKVMSGYANDIEDIQQIIYILENYSGQDLDELIPNIKRYKTVQLDSNEITGKGDLRTLQIEIPVEARRLILDVLKKQIYEFGQGLQQDIESVGNASGTALKFFYRKLELKSGKTEVQFRKGITELVRAILKYLNIKAVKIQQNYTRNMISNDVESSQIAKNSIGVVPIKYIVQNHPWIDDPDEALKIIEEEVKKSEESLEDKYNLGKGE